MYETAPSLRPRPPREDGGEELREQLAAMNRKLDLLTEQVAYLHRRTRAVDELKDELMPVARDAMAALSEELTAVEHEFNSEEVIYLLRKLVRNTPRFIRLLDHLESVEDFAQELAPLGKDVVRTVVTELDGMERRGYFRLLRGGLAVLDRVATHYTQEDIDRLAGNIVTVLDTVDNVTRPEVLAVANRAADVFHADADEPEKVGPWRLLASLQDPQVQTGLGVLLRILRQVANSSRKERENTPETGVEERR